MLCNICSASALLLSASPTYPKCSHDNPVIQAISQLPAIQDIRIKAIMLGLNILNQLWLHHNRKFLECLYCATVLFEFI